MPHYPHLNGHCMQGQGQPNGALNLHSAPYRPFPNASVPELLQYPILESPFHSQWHHVQQCRPSGFSGSSSLQEMNSTCAMKV